MGTNARNIDNGFSSIWRGTKNRERVLDCEKSGEIVRFDRDLNLTRFDVFSFTEGRAVGG